MFLGEFGRTWVRPYGFCPFPVDPCRDAPQVRPNFPVRPRPRC